MRGTALFVEHEEMRYLVTARHVLFDEVAAKACLQRAEREAAGMESPVEHIAELHRRLRVESGARRALDSVCQAVFRVRTLTELFANPGQSTADQMIALGSGDSDTGFFTFSVPELDLAVLSLNSVWDRPIGDRLIACGYRPVSTADFRDAPSDEGVDVFTVGFPESTAIVGEHDDPTAGAFSSRAVSLPLPTLAFGAVSMLHDRLPHVWCDMSVYPGNRRGPVIEANELVGIVSGNAFVRERTLESEAGVELPIWNDVRIPFGHMGKARYALELVAKQAEKDRRREAERARRREAQRTSN
jgi:hypothetical protein